jgi:hypothetical protein
MGTIKAQADRHAAEPAAADEAAGGQPAPAMSAPELGAPTGPAKLIDGITVRRYEHGWRAVGPPFPRSDWPRLKRRYEGEPVGGHARHARRRRVPFDDKVLADIAARAAEHKPISVLERPAGHRAPDWGADGPIAEGNCLRLSVAAA